METVPARAAVPAQPSPAVMSLRSLGLRTEVALLERAGSQVEDRGTHLVVRTPDNRTFFWGNFLLLRALPAPGGAREVMGACFTEFPEAEHRAITFDLTEPVDVGEFTAAGMTASTSVTLTATSLTPPPHRHADAELRPLASDEDWEQRVALTLAVDSGSPSGVTEPYARRRAAAERALGEQGAGARWGAFVDGSLVSTAALYRVGDDLARYQSVETHPDHRGQGLAGTLVHHVGEQGLTALGARTLVIVADVDEPAARLYRSLGFDGTEQVTELLERR